MENETKKVVEIPIGDVKVEESEIPMDDPAEEVDRLLGATMRAIAELGDCKATPRTKDALNKGIEPGPVRLNKSCRP